MDNELLNTPYISDILYQPDALRATLDGFTAMDESVFRAYARRLSEGSLKRVVLTGMGSSYYACHGLHLRLIEHGIPAEMIETSELIHFAPALFTPETLVVAVSQSGRSVELTEMLDMMGGRVPCIGITNTAESPLADQANAVLLTRAGEEGTVSCKTYISGLAGLLLLGDLLTGKDTRATLDACRTAADGIELYLTNWKGAVEEAIEALTGVRDVIYTGRGTSLSAVGTGGLICKEAAHFHSEGMSSAAFRHGPFEMTSDSLFVLVYAGLGPARKLNENLVADVKAAGGRTALVERRAGKSVFNLPDVPDETLPIAEILPAQIFSVALALLNHHAPGVFHLGSKVTEVA